MSARQVVGMHMPHLGERAERARIALARTLSDGQVDATGTFEITLEAADREQNTNDRARGVAAHATALLAPPLEKRAP